MVFYPQPTQGEIRGLPLSGKIGSHGVASHTQHLGNVGGGQPLKLRRQRSAFPIRDTP